MKLPDVRREFLGQGGIFIPAHFDKSLQEHFWWPYEVWPELDAPEGFAAALVHRTFFSWMAAMKMPGCPSLL
jgi:hypothetical protein